MSAGRRRPEGGTRLSRTDDCGQSNVVGVALLLGATVLALGVLTASVGGIVDGQAARADAQRVATGLDEALAPVETTGHHTGEIRFTAGRLHTVERDLRVLESGSVVATVPIDGLVYERGERRVRYVGGAILRGRGEGSWPVTQPPVVGSDRGVLVVGAPKLHAGSASVGGEKATVALETNVSHHRRSLGTGEFAVAVETGAPAALAAAFERRGATAVDRRDFDGDDLVSVVATFSGSRTGYLVVHDMRLEVNRG